MMWQMCSLKLVKTIYGTYNFVQNIITLLTALLYLLLLVPDSSATVWMCNKQIAGQCSAIPIAYSRYCCILMLMCWFTCLSWQFNDCHLVPLLCFFVLHCTLQLSCYRSSLVFSGSQNINYFLIGFQEELKKSGVIFI